MKKTVVNKKRNKMLLEKAVREKDMDARAKFIEENQALVYKIAMSYADKGIDLDDLVQEGTVGFITALEKFDMERGVEFSTYATWWIRQAIENACLKNHFAMDKPGNFSEVWKLIMRTMMGFKDKFGREPTISEIAGITKVSEETINGIMMLTNGVLSLESSFKNDSAEGESNFLDVIVDEDFEELQEQRRDQIDLRIIIKKALKVLTEKEKNVIILRYGLGEEQPLSLREAAVKLKISPERVRQVEQLALRKMRNDFDVYNLFKGYHQASAI